MYKQLMPIIYQTTLSKPVKFSGIGLHSGKKSEIRILPAEADDGIIFKRVDLKKITLSKLIIKKLLQQNYVPH